MTHIEDEDEKPLDPAIENIRRRMLRLLFISIGIMMVGLMAVLFAIVYKINASGSDEVVEPSNAAVIPGDDPKADSKRKMHRKFSAEINVDIPDGAEIKSSRLQRRKLILDLEMLDGSTQIWVVNMISGKVVSRVTIN